MERCIQDYRTLLSKGVCAEQARVVLPQSMMTEFYQTSSLYALYRFYKLR
jgi:thymidylate synthase (FAD)